MKKIEVNLRDKKTDCVFVDGEPVDVDKVIVHLETVEWRSLLLDNVEYEVDSLYIEGEMIQLGSTEVTRVTIGVDKLISGQADIEVNNIPMPEGCFLHSIKALVTNGEQEAAVRFMTKTPQDIFYGLCAIKIEKVIAEVQE